VVLMGLGQSPADASTLPTPAIGAVVCDGFTGMCTNPIFVRDVMFYADQFSPMPGGPFPRWDVGRVKVADDDLLGAGAGEVFAVGHLRVRPFATGFVSISTTAFGRFMKSNNPAHPYLFQGVALTHDPDAMRGQDFEFIGLQTGEVPPGPEKPPGR
jgi:hypothetical protein